MKILDRFRSTKIEGEYPAKLRALEKIIGYSFHRKENLKRALTHKSYVHEKRLKVCDHNERLEFLGDAVLELSISELLMERFPAFSEGQLSKLRAAIVNEKQLADIARSFNLGDGLFLGRGEEQSSGRQKSSLLADALEALLAAIYLDGGYKKAFAFIRHHYGKLLDETPTEGFYRDYKTDLQEVSQANYHSIPRYKLVGEQGPDHDKIFEIELYIREKLMGRGKGRSKKEAEQEAAREALEKLA